MRLGLAWMILVATRTRKSIPPAACIAAAAVITARMISIVDGWRPGRQFEHEHQNANACHAPKAQPEATHPNAQDDGARDNQDLKHDRDVHVPPLSLKRLHAHVGHAPASCRFGLLPSAYRRR